VQQVQIIVFLSPSRANTIVTQLVRFNCRVPTLENNFELCRLLSNSAGLKPPACYQQLGNRGRRTTSP
jgi:hypothetical protein